MNLKILKHLDIMKWLLMQSHLAVKQLVGRTLTASDKFNFTIEVAEGSEENTPMPYVISLQNLMSEISFGPLTFKEEGTYKYIIRENGIIAGVTNDTGYVIATVEVTDNNHDDVLESKISYEKKNASGETQGNEFKFVNTYSSSGTLEGKTNLKVTKNFTGRANDTWLDSDKFTFTLAADLTDTATVNAVKDGYIVLPTEKTLVVDKTNKEDAYFGDILFTKAGTYVLDNLKLVAYGNDGTIVNNVVTINMISPTVGTLLKKPFSFLAFRIAFLFFCNFLFKAFKRRYSSSL